MPISPLSRAASAAALAAAGAVAVFSAPAAAQTPCYPPTPGCFVTTTSSSTPAAGLTLTLSATTVNRGQTIQATLSGLRPGSTGIFTILSVEQQIGTFTASASGVGSASVTIPTNIELGNHTVFGKGIAANGSPGTASRGVVVVAAGTGGGGGGGGTSGGNLARTGAIVVPTALVGLGLVAGGAALKRSSRRSKTSSTV